MDEGYTIEVDLLSTNTSEFYEGLGHLEVCSKLPEGGLLQNS